MNTATRLNLLDALHAEAFAHARYGLYARRARARGHGELARVFDTAAREELEHFEQLAELHGLVGSDERNLEDAREAEAFAVETLYPVFVEHARAAGETALAERFDVLRAHERAQRAAFVDALARLERGLFHDAGSARTGCRTAAGGGD